MNIIKYKFVLTWHFLLFGGFINEPLGQLKSREKSSMLENGPCSWKTHVNEGKNKRLFLAFWRLSCTRNWSGLWTPVRTRSFSAFGRYLAHQTFAAETFKNTMVMRFGWWIPSKVPSESCFWPRKVGEECSWVLAGEAPRRCGTPRNLEGERDENI